MPQPMIPIDPTKPVSGNFKGTFAGAIAFIAAGFLSKKGIFGFCANFICDSANNAGVIDCETAEWTIAVLFMAIVGSVVNYAVTHIAQVRKLKELYEMLPQVHAEYEKTGMPDTQDPKRRG